MRIFWAIAIILSTLLACQTRQQVDLAAEEDLIKEVLRQYEVSIEMEDMGLYGRLVAHDTNMVNFGGFGDPIIGWEALQRVITGQNEILSQTGIEVMDLRVHVNSDGRLAWATNLWLLNAVMAGNPIELNIRCTWILEKRETGWAIVHFHKSMAQG